MFFNSIKEINRLTKEINRLLSKEMSNIYSKVTTEEKNWGEKLTFLKLQFSRFKKFVTMSVLGCSNSQRYHWILKLLVAT